jgi:hypothetical protein
MKISLNKNNSTSNFLFTHDMSLKIVALNELLSAVSTLVWFIERVNSNMQLIFLLILKRSRAHAALEWILINVRFDVCFQIV